jgi:hypothetical protein
VEDRPRKLAWTKLIQEIAWWIRTEQGYQQPWRTWRTVEWWEHLTESRTRQSEAQDCP